MSDFALDVSERRLVAALQCDPRATPENLAAVLGGSPRSIGRQLNRMLADGTLRIVATSPPESPQGVLSLRIRVLQGEVDHVVAALARRDDIPYVDLSVGGDQISAILVADQATAGRLVFRQLPSTSAITAVEAQPVIHVFSDSSDWRLDELTDTERSALTPATNLLDTGGEGRSTIDADILRELAKQPRATGSAIAATINSPSSTVRRRLNELIRSRRVVLQTFVDPHRLGLTVDAGLSMRVPPSLLDGVGRALAAHPAVHGVFATAGSLNLQAAVWLRDLAHLYEFSTTTLAELGIEQVDTAVVGRAVKRPGH